MHEFLIVFFDATGTIILGSAEIHFLCNDCLMPE